MLQVSAAGSAGAGVVEDGGGVAGSGVLAVAGVSVVAVWAGSDGVHAISASPAKNNMGACFMVVRVDLPICASSGRAGLACMKKA
jgi:hypothetical protein